MAANSDIKTVIALGFFDGVHRGHGRLIEMAKQRAAELGAEPAVLSFDVSPESVITGRKVPLISSNSIREDIVKNVYGVDRTIFYHFDTQTMAMPWSDFIDSLVQRFSAIHFVIGHDFHCGYKGQGSPQRISEYCREKGLGCDIIPKVTVDGITVSSTYIRELISQGDIQRANFFLGHAYTIAGIVQDGHKNGRKMGTPTINLICQPELLLPPHGVYITKVRLPQIEKSAVTNVGVRPTLGGKDEVSVESYILDFSGDLYGQYVSVDFYDFIRPEKKFSDTQQLREQILNDAETTRHFFKCR